MHILDSFVERDLSRHRQAKLWYAVLKGVRSNEAKGKLDPGSYRVSDYPNVPAKRIVNLTRHLAAEAKHVTGLFDLPAPERRLISEIYSAGIMPTKEARQARAEGLAELVPNGVKIAMIEDGWLYEDLITALGRKGVDFVGSGNFTQRVVSGPIEP